MVDMDTGITLAGIGITGLINVAVTLATVRLHINYLRRDINGTKNDLTKHLDESVSIRTKVTTMWSVLKGEGKVNE